MKHKSLAKCFLLVSLIVLITVSAFGVGQAEKKASEKVVSVKGGTVSEFYPDFGVIPVPSKKWRIGVMEKTLINDFWLDCKNGYVDAASDYGIEVDIYAAPSESDLLIQKQILDDMLAKNYDILCVSPITDSNLLTALAKATSMGVPIINSIDAHITPEAQKKHNIKIEAFITVDFKENTRLSVRYIAKKLGSEGGELIHIQGIPGGRCAEQRKAGYLEEIAKYPQLKSVGEIPGDWDRKKAMDIAADMLQSHPNLKGIVAANDNMALGALQAVKNAGKLGEVVVTGVDAIPDAIMSIKNGELDATTAFFQYQQAYMSIEAAILFLEGNFADKPKTIFVHQESWDASNVDEKIEQYKKQYLGLQKLGE
ncbi:MAG: substrate-binding domain-containing protein [Candidatus Caldatribacteriota bacterium]|nr:substrate-binding domain-containing protein [Candidatus Caldatribacteriota bacterium]